MKFSALMKRIMSSIAAIVLAVVIAATDISVVRSPVFVEAEDVNFDNTKVIDDLGSTVDLSKYPAVAGADPQIYSFMEYGYSDNAFNRTYYGLYLYVYNPSKASYVELTGANVMNMAFEYQTNADGTFAKSADGDLIATNYQNFKLKYCGASDGDYENLFLKFRVIGLETVLSNVIKMETEGFARRYDLVGFQLLEKGANTAQDYKIGQAVLYTGYAKGMGAGAEDASTLSNEWKKREVVELDVKHTFYRTETSSKGEGYQNQLDTVYFAVPERLFDEYGKLQRIKAEWYEYKTKEIVVTENSDFYNAAIDWVGQPVSDEEPDALGMYPYNEDVGYGLGIDVLNTPEGDFANWGWNLGEGFLHAPTNILYYLFLTKSIGSYDPYADIIEMGGVTSTMLEEWIYVFTEQFGGNNMLPIKDGTINADMFEDDIDENRKMDNERGKVQNGYSYYDFDADLDLQAWESWADTDPTFWDYWNKFDFGTAVKSFFGKVKEETGKTLPPIYELKAEDIATSKTDAAISENLCINYNHVDDLRAFYNDAISDDDGAGTEDEVKRVIMFRFAVSDYYAENACIVELGNVIWGGDDKYTLDQAYIAQQSVFFDFDIIQLTFNDHGVYMVIPVVSDPIDIINPVTPPGEIIEKGGCNERTFNKIMGTIVVAFVIYFVIKAIGKIRSWFIAEQTYRNTKKRK